jgi:hypothetical protein
MDDTLQKILIGVRKLVLLIPLLAGCAQDNVAHVVSSKFQSPRIERELKYYVANYSTNATNHFYVGATRVNDGELDEAFVYWKEEQTLLSYGELKKDAPDDDDAEAWGPPFGLKLGRDTVDTPEDLDGSTYLVTHRQWVDWMEQCIYKGKLHVVTLNEATNFFPNAPRPKADEE